jgi:hypothetical protein
MSKIKVVYTPSDHKIKFAYPSGKLGKAFKITPSSLLRLERLCCHFLVSFVGETIFIDHQRITVDWFGHIK